MGILKAIYCERMGRAGFVAAKDVVQEDGRVRFSLPAEGNRMDHTKLRRMMAYGGYRGDVIWEVNGQTWKHAGCDPVAAARTCCPNMAPAFEVAGVERTPL